MLPSPYCTFWADVCRVCELDAVVLAAVVVGVEPNSDHVANGHVVFGELARAAA